MLGVQFGVPQFDSCAAMSVGTYLSSPLSRVVLILAMEA
jgi:hypothetical protein